MTDPERTDDADRGNLDSVEERLTKLLSQPEMLPGVRLPTERALAEDLNISRSAVRRAMARLEGQGKVLRVIGSGTYGADSAPKPEKSP
ncbi:MAG: winged helix-turn-helix domain-containing protein, partial [Roseinatronobacter sp.]|nr:winged helix-turn-helix domain-containing protein [Roseinatronobacter sp.]